jgi:uncharacterized membrane protein
MTEQNSRDNSKTRLEALSDGLFAIIFTVLVLELLLGSHDFRNEEAFRHFIAGYWPKFLSYLLSFSILATYWIGHVEQFFFTHRINRPYILTNLLFLFFISLIPFSTILIGEYTQFVLSTQIYGLNLLCCQISLYINVVCLVRHQLHNERLDSKAIYIYKRYILIGAVLDVAGIILSYFSRAWGLGILATVPFIYVVLFVKDKRPLGGAYLKR